jgi:hypothetical protein
MSATLLLAAWLLAAPTHAHAATLDTAKIERLTGANGADERRRRRVQGLGAA